MVTINVLTKFYVENMRPEDQSFKRMSNMTKDLKKELLSLHNIVKNKDGNGYELQNNYYEDGNCINIVIPFENRDCHNCFMCSHFNAMDTYDGYCDIYNGLLNMQEGNFAWTSSVVNCAAYNENKVEKMNIIDSLDDMITFIEKTKNFFNCQEDYESYFGFARNWDEDTGDILETVRDYYNRGGKFENIPTEYPCVIRFDLDCEDDLEWIYIG